MKIPILLSLFLWYTNASSTQPKKLNVTKLDCGMRKLALDYAKKLVADESIILHIYDALRLHDLCKMEYDDIKVETRSKLRRGLALDDAPSPKDDLCENTKDSFSCIYVSASNDSLRNSEKPDGSINRPWNSIHDALAHTRSFGTKTIVLREGVHSLEGKKLELKGIIDNGLTIVGFPGESVWISGGLYVDEEAFECVGDGLYVANLTNLLQNHTVPSLVSLFTTSRRYIRARFPNSDPEIDQWGYASLYRRNYSISSEHVLEWHRPNKTNKPEFTFVDFSEDPPPGVPMKKNSGQPGYNWYASGHGGACSDIWGDDAKSYWCSNASQGGWAEVDQECATTGQMQIPVGMTYNTSYLPARFQNASIQGGIIHAWHSQSWAMHMFKVKDQTVPGKLTFEMGGGRQGGRNWCRCDQCTYAAGWCGQHQSPPWNDTRLIGGDWMIENVLSELDSPGEYFFDRTTSLLYVKPNSTVDLSDFRISMTENLLDIRNANNITIINVGFRDMAPTYMSDWSAPSGGDWSLHRGGAVFLENVANVMISNCTFRRLDGNAVFLSRKTRNVTIEESLFEWLGENAIATWGDTEGYDATAENFPMYTTIQKNVFREMGIYQKQSSCVGQCKAALTSIKNNVMFNTPRAAINFNDLVGGGESIEGNLIFNSCRESGDHGPINTWDRQPFLTTLRNGTKSFDPIPRAVHHNFIFANYGASNGVDNDDGSSWFHIYENLFYSADGFKMDYGGHDSLFEDNLIMTYPYDGQQCFDVGGGFFEGHADVYRRNRCLVGLGNKMGSGCGDPSCASTTPESIESQMLVGSTDCHGNTTLQLYSNEYYTPTGEALIQCFGDKKYSLEDIERLFGLEAQSKKATLPDEDTMLEWARDMVEWRLSNTKDLLSIK